MDARQSLKRIVAAETQRSRFYRFFPSSVERQHDDGTVDLLPDDEEVRGSGLSSIPLRHGLPGVTVLVSVGSRVMLFFEGGDPDKPAAALWPDGSSVERIVLGGTSGPACARQDDTVEVLLPPLQFTGTINGVTATGILNAPLVKMLGTIATGSSKVKVAT